MKWIVYIAIGLALAVNLGCKRELRNDSAALWITEMQASHTAADSLLAHRDVDAARDALIASWRRSPPSIIDAADARAIRQDVAYRLAELEIDARHPDAAMSWADRGLALGQDETVMTANLLMVRGRMFERAGQSQKAVADLHQALLINEKLLARTLENP
jgi:tetratricopeptide (TPR) repeat protein